MSYRLKTLLVLLPAVTALYSEAADRCRALLNTLTPSTLQTVSFSDGSWIRGETQEFVSKRDGYKITLIRETNGTVHFFDNSAVESAKILSEEEALLVRTRENGRIKSTVFAVDQKRAKSMLCNSYRELGNETAFHIGRKSFELGMTKAQLIQQSSKYCSIGNKVLLATSVSWVASLVLRGSGRHGFWLDHGDNFYMSLPIMMTLQNCLLPSSWSKAARIAVATGTGLGLNVLEEVNNGDHPLFITPGNLGNRKETDWADLNAGLGAVALYGAWAAYAESLYEFRFDQACRLP